MGMGWTYNAWVVAGSSQTSSNPFSCSQSTRLSRLLPT